MVPPTPAPKAPQKIVKVKTSCVKGAEEKFASNSGRGGGGGARGLGGLGDLVGGPPPPMVASRSNTSPLPLEGGSRGRLSCFYVFRAYSMTKPLALSQSVTVAVNV